MIQADKTGVGELRIKSDGKTIYINPDDIPSLISLINEIEHTQVVASQLRREPSAEESMKEAMKKGCGTIPCGFNIIDGTIGDEGFSIMVSGSRLYFRFNNGNRRASLDLQDSITEAYKISRT
jgi:hypothetical protein